MIKAAGILLLSPNNTALFLKRGAGGDFAGYWCLPGGKVEDGETTEEAALRELYEEVPDAPKRGELIYHTRTVRDWANVSNPGDTSGEVEFTTYVRKVEREFMPGSLGDEHVAWAWAPLESPPEPLHPGCGIALGRFAMDELGVAQAMSRGDLASPQRYMNMTLWDVRITGTGVAYRQKHNEFVYRRPENYLTPEFLARCNGLAVIAQHPEKSVLNSEEYGNRTVGSVLLPYIRGEEVWGIAKVYDDDTNKMMEERQLSTSPAVILSPRDNFKMELEDGSTLLVEGKPSLLDHLAICERGVWDKGEEPSGIKRGDSAMVDKTVEVEKEVKSDADAGQKLDKVLTCLDSLGKRMDSFEDMEKKKADAEEEAVKAAKEKADAEEKEKADAEAEELRKKGDAEQFKKDADEAEEKRKADAKADAQALVDAGLKPVADRIAEVAAKMPKALSDEDYHKMADAQARADDVFSALGARAPRPLDGEDLLAYRRRLAGGLKTHSAAWKTVDLTAIADAVAFDNIETQIYADATRAAHTPVDLPAGVLREVGRTDPTTGQRTVSFYGADTFFKGLNRGGRRLSRIVPRPGRD